MSKLVMAQKVGDLLKPGMRVFVAGGASEPLTIIEALEQQTDASREVTYVQLVLPGVNSTDFSRFHASAGMQTFMLAAPFQESYQAGRIEYLPIQLRALSTYLERGEQFDLSIIQLAEGEDPDNFNGGLNVDLLDAVLGNSKCIVAEINQRMPAPVSSLQVPRQRIDYLVSSSRAPADMDISTPTDEAREIGKLVAQLINDGDCIQTGIGNIPYAVLDGLKDKNDLGLHSGIVDDGVMMLANRGVLTGARKSIDKGQMVVCMAIGTNDLYDWTATREDLHIRPVSYTHDQSVLSRIENFVSINSALEIDFFGQINSEMINGRQIAGTGGSVDFMRGAAIAKGGKSIVAMTATAAKGKVSRIIPMLTGVNAATAARTDIGMVVTEFGVADLRYLSVRSRGDALIEIAAPQFRDELQDAWNEIKKRL